MNQDPPASLERVLGAVDGSEVIVYISAYDAVSGARRFFKPKGAYTKNSITELPFLPGSVEVFELGDDGPRRKPTQELR